MDEGCRSMGSLYVEQLGQTLRCCSLLQSPRASGAMLLRYGGSTQQIGFEAESVFLSGAGCRRCLQMHQLSSNSPFTRTGNAAGLGLAIRPAAGGRKHPGDAWRAFRMADMGHGNASTRVGRHTAIPIVGTRNNLAEQPQQQIALFES